MKKILCYIGSRNPNSNTLFFAENLINKIIEKEKMTYDIYTPNNIQIKPCVGCSQCFSKLTCSLKDDMNIFEEKAMNADIIILGSPVYSHDISGDTKILFDRMSYWNHILKLRGKLSIVISTCSTNGHTTAIDSLERKMTSTGTKVIAKCNAAVNYPEELKNELWLSAICEDIATKTLDAFIKGDYSNKNLEGFYQAYKKMVQIQLNNGLSNSLTQYWVENSMLDNGTLSDLLNGHRLPL